MPKDRPLRDQIISQLKYAIEDEQVAQRRYAEAAKLARHPKVEELLLFLAKEEQGHEEKLQKLLDEITAEEMPGKDGK
jgi:rubrerythrin